MYTHREFIDLSPKKACTVFTLFYQSKRLIVRELDNDVKRFNLHLQQLRNKVCLFTDLYKRYKCDNLRIIRNSFRLEYWTSLTNSRIGANNNFISHSSNPISAMWKIVNTQRQISTKINNPDLPVNSIIEFFVSKACKILNDIPPTNLNPITICCIKISANIKFRFKTVSQVAIRDILKSINNSNARDIYGTNSYLIKNIVNVIVEPLTKIINLAFTSNIFTDFMKIATVIPILKKGDRDNVANYRPISILPIFSKILEKAMSNQISDYLEQKGRLHDLQFGFRRDQCTIGAINESILYRYLNYTIYKHPIAIGCFEKGEYCAAKFIDLTCAFDCVSHDILLSKLINIYNFDMSSTNPIRSYLDNRYQHIYINNVTSDRAKVIRGVLQGSILGPLLFLIFINDMPGYINVSDSTCVLYADDATLLTSNNCKECS